MRSNISRSYSLTAAAESSGQLDDVLAGVCRSGVAKQSADPGVRAVGADQQVVRRTTAVGEVQQAIVGGFERVAPAHRVFGERVQQQVAQIGTVDPGSMVMVMVASDSSRCLFAGHRPVVRAGRSCRMDHPST
ncbi:MAG TPA: hypothetical protein VME19_14195 [Streptosporangiaceae bacterium]|nr:hypothetical protein [Streptosporangiaceae bacterium]